MLLLEGCDGGRLDLTDGVGHGFKYARIEARRVVPTVGVLWVVAKALGDGLYALSTRPVRLRAWRGRGRRAKPSHCE